MSKAPKLVVRIPSLSPIGSPSEIPQRFETTSTEWDNINRVCPKSITETSVVSHPSTSGAEWNLQVQTCLGGPGNLEVAPKNLKKKKKNFGGKNFEPIPIEKN